MDHFRNTHMMQIPIHPNNNNYVLHQPSSFQSFSPTFDSDGSFLPGFESFDGLSPAIDVDRSLTGVFSLLSLAPATLPLPPSFVHSQIGSSVEPGFGSRVMHSDLGVNCLLNRQGWYDDCGSRFDFDQNCSLENKKFVYSNSQFDCMSGCSSSYGSEIADKRMKFHMLDDYDVQNGCCSSIFQSQNQNQSQGQSQQLQFMNVWSLKELRGVIYTMAKDQNGCRILQAMIERSTMEEVEIVVSEVVDFISDLMKDQFGNYLVQKLLALCNDEQKMQLILSLTQVPTNIILVCMNPHGTRAVQKLLENLNPNQVKLVVQAIYRGAATLAMDPNGHHVIQYCLINFDSDVNKPILTEIANECYKIATDRSGCCVLQACVEHSHGEVRRRIITEIMVYSVHLAEDPFGNYVLQHMVGLNIPELTALLVRQLKGNFASLSCNKYASNVVEKCLNESGEEMSTRIIMELVGSPNASLLLVDPYANFVIQSALKVSKGFAHDCLVALISKNMLSMRTNLYGKKILERLEKKRVNLA